MVLRLFLGLAETGPCFTGEAHTDELLTKFPHSAFSPGVPLYLSFFYSRREIGFRQGCVEVGCN